MLKTLHVLQSTSVLLASSTLGDVPTNVDSSFEAYSSSVSTYYVSISTLISLILSASLLHAQNTTLSSRVHSGVVLSSKIISTLTQQTSKVIHNCDIGWDFVPCSTNFNWHI